jgi:hypothetical protein
MRPSAYLAAVLLLGTAPAWADHGGAPARDPAGSGLGLGWLFVVGLVVVVGPAGWALFAPAADEPGHGAPDGEHVPPRRFRLR